MKKLFVIAIALGAFALSSCTKEYTCDCTVPDYDTYYDWTAEYKKKADAEDACDATEAGAVSYDSTSTCELSS